MDLKVHFLPLTRSFGFIFKNNFPKDPFIKLIFTKGRSKKILRSAGIDLLLNRREETAPRSAGIDLLLNRREEAAPRRMTTR
jgi:hypothetical protein